MIQPEKSFGPQEASKELMAEYGLESAIHIARSNAATAKTQGDRLDNRMWREVGWFLRERLAEKSIYVFLEVARTFQMLEARGPYPWSPSEVSLRFRSVFEAQILMPRVILDFRRWFAASGWINFPDIPRPKEHLQTWDENRNGQRFKGAKALLKMAYQLYRHRPFPAINLADNLIGNPVTYPLPVSVNEIFSYFAKFLLPGQRPTTANRTTEAQIRYNYYRGQIKEFIGDEFGTVLEIAGGFGGLAAELIKHGKIERYYIVELPVALPFLHYYLHCCFDCPIQFLSEDDTEVDPNARIVVMPPWKLEHIVEDIDLLINTMAFQHMSFENVDFYLKEANRLKTKYMYLVNRDVRSDPTDPLISEYPIPPGYTRISEQKTIFWKHREFVYHRNGNDVD